MPWDLPSTMTTIPTPPDGSETLLLPGIFLPEKSTSAPSSTSAPTMLPDTPRSTSSPGSAAGHSPFPSPDGPRTAKSGPPACHANPTQAPDNGAEQPTSVTYGQFSFGWSTPADPQPSSASRSLPPTLSAALLKRTRTCRTCSTAKPFSEFYVNSKGTRRRTCKDCDREAERRRKRANPELTHDRHRKWRRDYRGHALVNVAKNRAKARGIPFDLSPMDIQKRIEAGHCELTGIAFNLDEPRAWNAPSLDQRNPGAGYTRDNVRVVLYALNVMANVWGENRIIEIAHAITARRIERSNDLSRAIGDALKARIDLNGSPEYELTWNEVVTPSGHALSRLRASARRISGNACSGWQSPKASDLSARKHHPEREDGGQPNLAWEAQLAGWPTPNTPSGGRSSNIETMSSTGMTLDGRKHTVSPEHVAKFAGWVTPQAHDVSGRSQNQKAKHGTKHGCAELANQVPGVVPPGSPASTEKPGALNPLFSLWLMLGNGELARAWASCAAQATPSSRKPPQPLSKPSSISISRPTRPAT